MSTKTKQPQQQYYYKILSDDLKSLCYLASSNHIHSLAIQYYTDKWNYPPEDRAESHLFVFRSIKDVRYFIYCYPGYNHCVIYKVEVKGIKQIPRFINPWEISIEKLSFICQKIRRKMKFSQFLSIDKMPRGTVAVSAIKLVEEVGLDYDPTN